MNVFISSVIAGYEHFRDAAAQAIEVLGHEVIRAEEFVASPSAPQQVCLQGVRDADVIVLLMGERYGYVAPSGLSATHEEYREAKERKPLLVFVESKTKPEADQQTFINEVQSYVTGHYRAAFATEEELTKAVIQALHRYEVSTAAGPIDEAEIVSRAELPPSSRSGMSASPLLLISVAAGPRQQVLRPTEIEDVQLSRSIKQEALFGQTPLFDSTQGSTDRIVGGVLIVEQGDRGASVRVDELGTVRIALPLRSDERQNFSGSMALIEEDVLQKVSHALRFCGWLLDQIDSVRRLSDVVIVAGMTGASYLGWQTRAESVNSGRGVQVGRGGEQVTVHLSPPRRNRSALLMDTTRITEDIVALLRREVKG